VAESFLSQLRQDPAFSQLMDSTRSYVTARAEKFGQKTADEATDTTEGGVSGAQEGAKAGAIKGTITGAVKGLFGKAGGATKRPTNIYESVLVGAPVEQVWEAWQNYDEFPGFMKGPESVKRDEDGKTVNWTAKIFLSRRSWKGIVEEEIENERLKWKSEAPKGTVDGSITFTPMGDNLTHVLVILEYRSKGVVEWVGNRWRTVGRRSRLDLKHFARKVTMEGYERPNPPTEEGESG
jgi:uncharacterized membrane protein